MTRSEQQRERVHGLALFDCNIAAKEGAVCGIDEVGRGPLAGPVYAACVMLPLAGDALIETVNDSKKLSERAREQTAERIRAAAQAYGIGFATVEEIERYNILEATKLAMRRAYEAMGTPAYALVDAIDPAALALAGRGVVKGDAKSYHIAAASILAKVERDALMVQLDAQYPGYGLAKNKGYGTRAHIDGLLAHGPSPIHRRSFLTRILGE